MVVVREEFGVEQGSDVSNPLARNLSRALGNPGRQLWRREPGICEDYSRIG
jgi:hypothetical protein